eukprot:1385431-Prymnesium_polylepis.1
MESQASAAPTTHTRCRSVTFGLISIARDESAQSGDLAALDHGSVSGLRSSTPRRAACRSSRCRSATGASAAAAVRRPAPAGYGLYG